jgi:hypothetical protein
MLAMAAASTAAGCICRQPEAKQHAPLDCHVSLSNVPRAIDNREVGIGVRLQCCLGRRSCTALCTLSKLNEVRRILRHGQKVSAKFIC